MSQNNKFSEYSLSESSKLALLSAVSYLNESLDNTLNESMSPTEREHDEIKRHAISAAKAGHRVVINGKTAWAGLGNRSGLHSYADELIDTKWKQSGDKLKKKLSDLGPGDEVELHSFNNTTRDRGRWNKFAHMTVKGSDSNLSEAAVRTNSNGESFIQFKCPGFSNATSPKKHHAVMKKMVDTIDKNSQEFSGSDVSKLISPTYHGDFVLYKQQHFKGSDGHTYKVHGVDTENWRGFSLRITRLNPENAKKVQDRLVEPGKAEVPDFKFDKHQNILRESVDGVDWDEDKYRKIGDELVKHADNHRDDELRMSELHYNRSNGRYYANVKSNKGDFGDYSFKLSAGNHHSFPQDVREEETYHRSGMESIGSHDSKDNVDIH